VTAEGQDIQFGKWIGDAFGAIFSNWQTWSIIGLISTVPLGVFYVCYELAIVLLFRGSPLGTLFELFSKSLARSVLSNFVLTLFLAGIASIFIGGIVKTTLKQIRQQPIKVTDLFAGFEIIAPVFVANVLIVAATYFGSLLCIIPGLIVQGVMFFSIPLIVDQGFEPVDAIRKSFELTKANWIIFSLVALLAQIISTAGFFLCCVGVFLSYPLAFMIQAYAYERFVLDSGN